VKTPFPTPKKLLPSGSSLSPLQKHPTVIGDVNTSFNNTDMSSENHAPVAEAAQDSWGSMPKRKPVPTTTAAIESGEAASGQTSLTNDKPATPFNKKTLFPSTWLPPGGLGLWFASQKRSRKFLIIGIGAGIVLIALIIGLAVGLTVGKRYVFTSN
jgi:hypothetical protein